MNEFRFGCPVNRGDGNETELNRFFSSEPLVDEGDLTPIYQSKTRTLPEILNEEAFTVTNQHQAQALKGDMQLRTGANIVLSSLEDLSNTYFVVDIGHAHLPGVAEILLERGVDCYFVIPESINPRFHETIKYWAKRYKDAKGKLKQPKGFATFIDAHRSDGDQRYELSAQDFPTVQKLRELGINKIIYLNEGRVGPFTEVPKVNDLLGLFHDYQTSGLNVTAYGIDQRQGLKDKYFLP